MTNEEGSVPQTPPVPRLPRGARREELARVPIRLRGGTVTLSAWRLHVESEEGPGAITLVEEGADDRFFRGDGAFLGWTQDDLKGAWDQLSRTPEEPEAPTPQLG
ncbi:MAG: hypothetical protein ACM3JH_03685 [Acidithiobacillales bacterium]